MKKEMMMFMLTIFLMVSQLVAASSISGWILVPQKIQIGETVIELEDISTIDGSLFVKIQNETTSKEFLLPIGSNVSFNYVTLSLQKSVVGTKAYAYLQIEYPILFEGGSIRINQYNITLLSVTDKGVRVMVKYENSSKEFTTQTIEIENIKISLTPYPKIFSGYLKRGSSISFYGHNITLEDVKIENSTDGYKEVVIISIDGTQHEITVGENLDTQIFHIETHSLIGVDYLSLDVYAKGAYIDMQVHPDFSEKVYEGKDAKMGPYLVRAEYIVGDSVYVSIRNNCGQVLSEGFIHSGDFTSMKYYKGLGIVLDSTGTDSNGKYADIIGFLYPEEIPSIKNVSLLDVSLLAPQSNPIQYQPFTAKVIVKNIGDTTLNNVYIRYSPSKGIEVLSGGDYYIESLPPKASKEYTLVLRSNLSGEISLGKVVVTADVPYELACGGYTKVTFYSNSPFSNVTRARIKYLINLDAPSEVQVGKPFEVRLSVQNAGNVNVPVLINIPLEKSFALVSSKYLSYSGESLSDSISLEPNETKEYPLTLVAITPGKFNISAVITFQNRKVAETSQEIIVSVPLQGNYTQTITFTHTVKNNESVHPETITVTQTITQTIPKTITMTVNNTIEITPLKSKVIWWIIGFVIGAGIMILIAWIKARSS